MLRMPELRFQQARCPAEALELWHGPGEALYLAGGTDLLPNLKHRLLRPARLVGLGAFPRAEVRELPGELRIDAWISLHRLATHPAVLSVAPVLARAASVVGGPQVRRMGTLGGNLLLDTRCRWYNQGAGWREALGNCLKKDGDWCHVLGSPRTCVAACCADTVPVLVALGASAVLLGPAGEREIPVGELYRFDGRRHLAIEPGELLVELRVPRPPGGHRGVYLKLRTRGAIDFPLLGLAVCGTWRERDLVALRMVAGAAGPCPKAIRGLDDFAGRPLDAAAIERISALVRGQVRPQPTVACDASWRRAMAGVLARRALEELARAPA